MSESQGSLGAGPDNFIPPSGKRIFFSEELFQGRREIMIVHNGGHYRLMQTKSGKLILNK